MTVLDAFFCFPAPRRELAEIRRILKDDGLLAIEIPGFRYRKFRDRGLICYLADGRWSRISPRNPDLYYFSPATLKALLDNAGFRIRQVIPQQAPTRRNPLLQCLNRLHFNLNRGLFAITRGRTSFAAKEMLLVQLAAAIVCFDPLPPGSRSPAQGIGRSLFPGPGLRCAVSRQPRGEWASWRAVCVLERLVRPIFASKKSSQPNAKRAGALQGRARGVR